MVTESVSIAPLTEDRWTDIEALFGQGGDPKTCWCVYWRLRGKDWSLSSAGKNREHLREIVEQGPAPGLLAYRDGIAVGWVSLGPREDFARLEASRIRPRLDDVPVWSIVCFVVARTERGQGLARKLLEAAVQYATDHGAPALEAYPVDSLGAKVSPGVAYTGLLSTFKAAGFRVVHEIDSPQATVNRVIVRRELAPVECRPRQFRRR
jgi:GNAT superfamily N-acetyltransferase